MTGFRFTQDGRSWYANIFEKPEGYDIDFVWEEEAEYTYTIQRHDPAYDMSTRAGRKKAVLDAYINCADVTRAYLGVQSTNLN